LNRAYEVLSDPGLKKNYDHFGAFGIGTSAASDVDVGREVNQRSSRRRPDMSDFHPNDEFYGGFGNPGPRGGSDRRYNSGPVGFDTFASGPWDFQDGPSMDDGFSSTRWEDVGVGNGADSRWGGVSGVGGMGGSSSTRASKGQRRSPHEVEEDVDFDWFGHSKKSGATNRAYGPVVGHDIALDFEVDFKTAVLGGKTEVTVNRFEKCEPCKATGARPGTKKTACGTCGGSGISIPVNSRSGPVFSIACPDCRGTGETIPNPCSNCHGAAINQKTAKITVDIPAGVMDGNRMRVEGAGDVGPNAGPSGDLFLFLKVKKDPTFRREGSDIFGDVTISCVDAIVGTSTKVPVVDGEATIEIPPGTQPGHVICVKKHGAHGLIGDGRGDHFVTVEVEIPNGDEDKENQLVQLLKQPTTPASGSSVSNPSFAGNTTASDVKTPHNFSAPFPKTDDAKSKETKAAGKTPTTNASVPFPKTEPKAAGKTPTTNASVPFPKTPPTTPQPAASNKSTMIDNATLATLKGQAAKAEEEKKERMKFEELAAAREKEIQEQAKRLEVLEAKAAKQEEERAHFEKIADEREIELKENVQRQEEMNKEITVRVRQSHGQATRFTIKKSMEMSRIFEMVARQKGTRSSDMEFMYEGIKIAPSDTPLDLDMDTDCVIDFNMARRRAGSGAGMTMGGGVGMGVRYM
jgi:DnaJ-class molecular chaperone